MIISRTPFRISFAGGGTDLKALRIVGITSGLEITSMADIPARTGLGSSSSFTVGLLNALYAYQGIPKTAAELAQEAARIEIEILGEPIGKQDHYIAAYGGMQFIQFNSDESVHVNPVICSKWFTVSVLE